AGKNGQRWRGRGRRGAWAGWGRTVPPPWSSLWRRHRDRRTHAGCEHQRSLPGSFSALSSPSSLFFAFFISLSLGVPLQSESVARSRATVSIEPTAERGHSPSGRIRGTGVTEYLTAHYSGLM